MSAADGQSAPQVLHAEQAVIRGLLHDPSRFADIDRIVAPEMFTHQRDAALYRAIRAVAAKKTAIDAVTVLTHLEQSGELEQTGGAAYLNELAHGAYTAANLEHYARSVRERWQAEQERCRIAALGAKLAALAGRDDANADALQTAAHAAILDAKIEPQSEATGDGGLVSIGLVDFLSEEFPPRELLLDPWLESQGLVMLHAPRGVGKTHFSLGVGYAVASGGQFLRWQAPKPTGVLFIDGEMPATTLQKRLAEIVKANDRKPTAPFQIITPDKQSTGMPDLATAAGQALIDRHIDDSIGLIIVDNLSALVRSGKENESEGWMPIQRWTLRWRSRGKSVLLIHHSGKSGKQRGTSKREDLLDAVIALRHPPDYSPDQGAVFEIHFEKTRDRLGAGATPFLAALNTDEEGRQVWSVDGLSETNYDKVVAMYRDGISQAEIARQLKVDPSTVSRHVNKAKEQGAIR